MSEKHGSRRGDHGYVCSECETVKKGQPYLVCGDCLPAKRDASAKDDPVLARAVKVAYPDDMGGNAWQIDGTDELVWCEDDVDEIALWRVSWQHNKQVEYPNE